MPYWVHRMSPREILLGKSWREGLSNRRISDQEMQDIKNRLNSSSVCECCGEIHRELG